MIIFITSLKKNQQVEVYERFRDLLGSPLQARKLVFSTFAITTERFVLSIFLGKVTITI